MNGNFKLDGRTIIIGILILVGAVLFLPRLFDTGSTTPEPGSEVFEDPNAADALTLGQPVSAASVDQDGCPTQTTTTFGVNEDIFVVAPNSDIPSGTSVFVRLYQDGAAVEDTNEITADQNYSNTCLNFQFEPVDGPLDPGTYEAEFIVNGNPGPTVSFELLR
jgi:hypothetical protein